MVRSIVKETKKDGGVRSACDYGYLNLVTVGDAFLKPPSTKCCTVSLFHAESYKVISNYIESELLSRQ